MITYHVGIPERYKLEAVELYDEAFNEKLSLAIPCEKARKKLFYENFMPQYAIGAISKNTLHGIAGFHTNEGSLTGTISYRALLSQLGFLRGNRAALVFSLYERKPKPGEIVMDGIAVRSNPRVSGIGSTLLDEIIKYAKQHGYNSVRLDVIDTNPRAKALYERLGFRTVSTEYFPYLRKILGFGGVTTMKLITTKESRL